MVIKPCSDHELSKSISDSTQVDLNQFKMISFRQLLKRRRFKSIIKVNISCKLTLFDKVNSHLVRHEIQSSLGHESGNH
jgi:hypothetical protein